MDRTASFLVVDDAHIVRDGFIAILEFNFTNSTVFGASSCKDTLDLCSQQQYDALILDINLCDGSALDILPILIQNNPHILLTSASINISSITKGLQLGAIGFLSKFASTDEFIYAVKSTMKKQRYICSFTIENLIFNDQALTRNTQDDPLLELTNKEIQIAKMITNGLTSKEIANDIGISFATVNKHRNNILKKLKINSSKHLRSFFNNSTAM